MKKVIYLEENRGSADTVWAKKMKGKRILISESEFERLFRKYMKPVKLIFYKADTKAVNEMEKGNITYKGQMK